MALTGLALRELWISFRLLLVVGALLLASIPTLVLPQLAVPAASGAPGDPSWWLALGLAVGLALAAGVAAATLSAERRRGTAGWIATRPVPRATVVLTWFAAFALLLIAGLVPAGVVARLSVEPILPVGPAPLAVAVASAGCAGMVAVAAGLLLGALLPVAPAGLLAALASGAWLVASAAGPAGSGAWWSLPADGLRIIAMLGDAARPVADSLRAAGVALGLASVLLIGAIVAFERADL